MPRGSHARAGLVLARRQPGGQAAGQEQPGGHGRKARRQPAVFTGGHGGHESCSSSPVISALVPPGR
eukprot:8841442-Heterocapsa_arctica.AAC.1